LKNNLFILQRRQRFFPQHIIDEVIAINVVWHVNLREQLIGAFIKINLLKENCGYKKPASLLGFFII
jgi:hypothetical protein